MEKNQKLSNENQNPSLPSGKVTKDSLVSADLSGRELDAAVAERVMGWRWMARVNQDCAWLFPPDSVDVDTGEEGMFGEPIIIRNHIVGPFKERTGERKQETYNVPCYSTDIAAAMEVVEKMRADGWAVDIWDEGLPTWSVEFARGRHEGLKHSASLPEAICHAALEATQETKTSEASVS